MKIHFKTYEAVDYVFVTFSEIFFTENGQRLNFTVIAIIGYASVGWALAYGPNSNPSLEPFFGLSEFFLSGTTRLSYFFFQFVFAATASTIITGIFYFLILAQRFFSA